MTEMLDTSLETYKAISKTDKQEKVLATLTKRFGLPLCNWQIAYILKWPINCVTGRIKELREKGLVIDDGKRPGPPQGRTVHYWKAVKVKPEPAKTDLF